MFAMELKRLARRTAVAVSRPAVALILLGVLAVKYRAWSAGEPTLAGLAGFAESFTVLFLIVQAGALALLTPALVAGALARPGERDMWTLLLASPRRTSGFILARFSARLVPLAAVILAGLPVLAAATVWGGVEPARLAAAYVYLFSYVAAAGAVALYFSLTEATTSRAMTSAYLVVVACGVGGLCSPEGAEPYVPLSPAVWVLRLFGGWSGGVAVWGVSANIGLAAGVLGLVAATGRRWLRGRSFADPKGDSAPRKSAAGRRRAARTTWRPSLDEENPLLWKECWVGGESWLSLLRAGGWAAKPALVFAGLVATALVYYGILAPACGALARDGEAELWGNLAGVNGLLLAVAVASAGLQAAVSVAGERARGTWEPLLSAPVEGGDILAAKSGAALAVGHRGLLAMTAFAAYGFALKCPAVRSAWPLLNLAALWLFSRSAVRLAVGLGLAVSVRGRSAGPAMAWWGGLLTASAAVAELTGYGPVWAWARLHSGDVTAALPACAWAAVTAAGAGFCTGSARRAMPGPL